MIKDYWLLTHGGQLVSDRQGWLRDVDDKLTDIDKQNLDLIKLYENMSDEQENIVSSNQLFFSWGKGYLEGNFAPAKFYFYKNGDVTYASADTESSYLLGWRGSYTVKGNILYIRVTEIFYNPFVAFMPNAFPYNLQKIVVDPGIELRFPLSKIKEGKVKDCTGKDVDSVQYYINVTEFEDFNTLYELVGAERAAGVRNIILKEHKFNSFKGIEKFKLWLLDIRDTEIRDFEGLFFNNDWIDYSEP